MLSFDVRVDVSDAVGTGEHLDAVATVFVADPVPATAVALFGFAGGGYNRRYFDLRPDGRPGYSEAEHHVAHGQVFVACDHIGTGDSDTPTRTLDFSAVGRANASTASAVLERLRQGRVHDHLPPIAVDRAVGVGHSYGGFILTLGQAEVPVFDGVAFLGWSGIHTHPPWPSHLTRADVFAGAANGLEHPTRPIFHFEDVPEELIVLDLTKVPGTMGSALAPWGSQSLPGGRAVLDVRDTLEPGAVALEASRIDVPVFIGCSEVDVVPDPRAEPAAYGGSSDITVCVIPRMGHVHNLGGTRALLWERLARWAETIPSVLER